MRTKPWRAIKEASRHKLTAAQRAENDAWVKNELERLATEAQPSEIGKTANPADMRDEVD